MSISDTKIHIFYKMIGLLLCIILVVIYGLPYAYALRPTAYRISNGQGDEYIHKTSSAGSDDFFKHNRDIVNILKHAYKKSPGDWDHVKGVAETFLTLSQQYPTDDSIDKFAITALLSKIPDKQLLPDLLKKLNYSKHRKAEILHLVKQMHKISATPYLSPGKAPFDVQNHMDMIVKMAGSCDMMLLVFADKLHNFNLPSDQEHKEYLHREIMHIYSPLAERLQLIDLASKLREQAFQYTYPSEYADTKNHIEKILGITYEETNGYLDELIRQIDDILRKEGLHPVRVEGRVKTVYSVYEKLKTKGYTIDQIEDLFGIRMVAESQTTLWALVDIPILFGDLIEGQLEHKIERNFSIFKNTTKDKNGIPCEWQFMSSADVKRYNYGDSASAYQAHWTYKLIRETGQRFNLDGISEDNPRAYFTELLKKLDAWVFVFKQAQSLRGVTLQAVRLPKGSTPADFAALPCVDALNKDYDSAVVCNIEYHNGELYYSPRMLSGLDYLLQNGQVTLVVSKADAPKEKLQNLAQLIGRYSKTLRARLLRTVLVYPQKMQKAITDGKRMLEKAGFPLTNPATKTFLDHLVVKYGLKDKDELYASLQLAGLSIERIKGDARVTGQELLRQQGVDLNNTDVLRKLYALLTLPEFRLPSISDLFFAVGIGSKGITPKLIREQLSASGPKIINDWSKKIACAA